MAVEFEADVTALVEHAVALADRYGTAKAARILECPRPHYDGISCVCGWLDDGEMPLPTVVEKR